MRFAHLSDLHLGKRVCEFSMLEDQKYILEQILALLDAHPVDGVLLADDLYDKPVPPAEAVRLLEHCCAATRHMGTHRNRGLGNVRLAYIRGAGKPAAPQNPALPDAGMVTLTYHVQLKMPLTLPGCGEQLTAIPARSVIGCLAGAYLRQGTAADAAFRQLFLDGTAR